MRVAFISGTSILNSRLFDDWERSEIETRYGAVSYRKSGEFVIINRHGDKGIAPPHAINHRANIQALADLGFQDVVSITSVGSLKEELRPGDAVACDDYVCFRPATFSDEVGNYEAPRIANNLIEAIRGAVDFAIEPGKVYVQMIGPRFETPAEIRIIRDWGDVVGMNMASEADLCREASMCFNTISMIDNYANGISNQPISFERFRVLVARNQEKVNHLFEAMIRLFR